MPDICLRRLLHDLYSRAMKFFMFPTRRRSRLFLVLTVLVVGLQACGGGGDASSGPLAVGNANIPAPVAIQGLPSIPTLVAQEPAAAPAVPAPAQTATSLSPPLDPASSCSIPDLHDAVMQQINAARASGQTCGGQALPPAGPLVWNDLLFAAAAGHSLDMAARNYFAHVSPEGVTAAQRVSNQGYGWSAVGENIAAGDVSVQGVMALWLGSDGHCRNIMNPIFAEVAVACVQQAGTTYGTYWTMVLGSR
jgi:uncharacterized protein YkwD